MNFGALKDLGMKHMDDIKSLAGIGSKDAAEVSEELERCSVSVE
jgi:hypothetical protein